MKKWLKVNKIMSCRHLLKHNVENKVMTLQVVDKEIVTGDSIAIFANKNDQKNPPDVPHTLLKDQILKNCGSFLKKKLKGMKY